jgi:hypothetical protein
VASEGGEEGGGLIEHDSLEEDLADGWKEVRLRITKI